MEGSLAKKKKKKTRPIGLILNVCLWYWNKINVYLSFFIYFDRTFNHKSIVHLILRLHFCISGVCWFTSSLPSFPSPFWPEVVVFVRVPSGGWKHRFVIMFKMMLNFINTLALKTMILQQSLLILLKGLWTLLITLALKTLIFLL